MHQLPCVGNVVVVDRNLNQFSYIDLVDGTFLELVEQMFRDQQHPFVFQKDNAPCHRAMAVEARLENNDKRKMLLPPQFPDVNPIENMGVG